jgi:protein SCO1/2
MVRPILMSATFAKLGLCVAAITAVVALQAYAEDMEGQPAAERAAHQHHHTSQEAGEGSALGVKETEPEADDPHAHHHHHPAPKGVTRTLASYTLPNLTMVDQNGDAVSIQELLSADKPTLVNFIFTTCTAICPVMSATFERVQRELGEDAGKVLMVSVSIDPEQDTPSALADYAKRFHAGPQWTFLTGSLEDSIAVQKAFDAYRGDKMNHAPLTLLRGAPDAAWIRFDGFATAGDLVEASRAMLGGDS